jgi:hypothetical protein
MNHHKFLVDVPPIDVLTLRGMQLQRAYDARRGVWQVLLEYFMKQCDGVGVVPGSVSELEQISRLHTVVRPAHEVAPGAQEWFFALSDEARFTVRHLRGKESHICPFLVLSLYLGSLIRCQCTDYDNMIVLVSHDERQQLDTLIQDTGLACSFRSI